MQKTYICTAIPYVNGTPHIGHAVDYLLADVYARFCRKNGDEVRFQVGTDEHGNKVFSTAAKNGLTVEAYAAKNSQKFQDFIQKLEISYTDIIRTTDPDHVRRCQEIWKKLTPHIYSADYDGWYCEGCESFVTEKEYAENDGACPDHKTSYQKLTEKNYYLRMDDFRDTIRAKIESDEMQILPEFRKQEMLRLLADTPDISISRPRKQLSWGVPVPGDDSQVMYVWIDALSNYITVLGYPDFEAPANISQAPAPQTPAELAEKTPKNSAAAFASWWPAAAQFVGKDILRFHTITWPAILLGLDLELPRKIVSHGHVLSGGQKMSKTIGNVVDPIAVLERHGLEAFRYYFLRHVDTFADSDFTWEKFDEAYNNELANDLGNLVQRLATLCRKNSVSGILASEAREPRANPLTQPTPVKTPAKNSANTSAPIPAKTSATTSLSADEPYAALMSSFEFSKAFDYAWEKVQQLNKSIDAAKPWELAKRGETDAVVCVLTELVRELLAAAELLAPFLPATATRITEVFTAAEITPPSTPLFPKN